MSDTNENKFEVINGGKGNSNDTEKQVLKVFHSELKTVEFSNVDELFCGFDTIKAITFSYDIRFINHLMQYFQYGEIILGADFMVHQVITGQQNLTIYRKMMWLEKNMIMK